MKDDESRHVRDAACALFSGKRVEPLDVRRPSPPLPPVTIATVSFSSMLSLLLVIVAR